MFWLWLHTLQCDIANQILEPEEDKRNKQDRPLPAGRISGKNAIILRWVLVPTCLMLSACYSVETAYASMALCFFTYIYDEGGYAAGHWLGKNVLNALGLASFEVGACLIAGMSSGVFTSGFVLITHLSLQAQIDIPWTILRFCQRYAAQAYFALPSRRRTSRIQKAIDLLDARLSLSSRQRSHAE